MKEDQDPLLLVVDVGNTNAVFGLFCGRTLVRDFRVSTDAERTADEYAALLLPLFEAAGLRVDSVEAVMVSSVVPTLNLNLEQLARRYFGVEALFVSPDLETGMEVRYDHPRRARIRQREDSSILF